MQHINSMQISRKRKTIKTEGKGTVGHREHIV